MPASADRRRRRRRVSWRIVVVPVVASVAADLVTAWIFGLGCAIGENSPQVRGSCDLWGHRLPLLGVPVAVGGGIASWATGRRWPVVLGALGALGLATWLWVTRGDPAGNF